MKRIVATLAAAALITASLAAPAFADGGGRRSHGPGVADALLWPITAALTIPAAIVGTVAQATIPHPVVYESPAPAYAGPAAYAGPKAYYAPRGCDERREEYQSRWHEHRDRYDGRDYGRYDDRW